MNDQTPRRDIPAKQAPPGQDVEEQVRSLLQVIEVYQMRRCEELLREAEHQAADIVKQAYLEGRQRLHQAIIEERQRGRAAVAALEAQLQTRHRQRRQQVEAVLLQRGLERLRAELVRRWRDPSTRQLWVDGLLHQGLKALPHRDWCITHPQDWPREEQDEAAALLRTRIGGALEFRPGSGLQAGLKICSGGTCLDGTLPSLLTDRRAVEGQLLALLRVDEP
jgi:hypothetical protein